MSTIILIHILLGPPEKGWKILHSHYLRAICDCTRTFQLWPNIRCTPGIPSRKLHLEVISSRLCHLMVYTSATLHFVTDLAAHAGTANRNLHSEAGSRSILHEMFPVDLENEVFEGRDRKQQPERFYVFSDSLAVCLLNSGCGLVGKPLAQPSRKSWWSPGSRNPGSIPQWSPEGRPKILQN